MNEKMDKKQKNLFIVAVVTMIAIVAGATYAYFSVGTTNTFGTSTINATADSMGSVILQGTNANLTMNLSAVDMMKENVGIGYYATPEGKTTDYSKKETVIARATVSPTTDTNYYHCSYTLNVTQSYTGDKNMYNIFKGTQQVNGQTYTASGSELVLLVNGHVYDLQSNVLPKEIEGEFYIKGEQEKVITAGLIFINSGDKDQTLLAGSGVNLNIEVKPGTFTCTAEEEPQRTIVAATFGDYTVYLEDLIAKEDSFEYVTAFSDISVDLIFDTNDIDDLLTSIFIETDVETGVRRIVPGAVTCNIDFGTDCNNVLMKDPNSNNIKFYKSYFEHIAERYNVDIMDLYENELGDPEYMEHIYGTNIGNDTYYEIWQRIIENRYNYCVENGEC